MRGRTEVRDYNGVGDWSLVGIQKRYRDLARRLRQPVLDLMPKETVQGDVRWIYPLMDEVVVGIKRGDAACVELGVQFIESGPAQPFGKSLHSNTARALRRAVLTPEQVDRLRARILRMLTRSEVPREYSDYAKLVRRVGLGDDWPRTREAVDASNPHVMVHVRYFEAVASNERAVQPRLKLERRGVGRLERSDEGAKKSEGGESKGRNPA